MHVTEETGDSYRNPDNIYKVHKCAEHEKLEKLETRFTVGLEFSEILIN